MRELSVELNFMNNFREFLVIGFYIDFEAIQTPEEEIRKGFRFPLVYSSVKPHGFWVSRVLLDFKRVRRISMYVPITLAQVSSSIRVRPQLVSPSVANRPHWS